MTLPLWLDPQAEIAVNDHKEAYQKLDDTTKSVVFILTSYRALRKADPSLTPEQTVWVIGNSIAETGWGRFFRGNNFGGWKISKDYADAYKKRTGKSALWWQDAGHIASGDEAVCYYRGFANPEDFYAEWLTRFLPKHGKAGERYTKTGSVFWDDHVEGWFRELCISGYKGPVTALNPDKSFSDWRGIVHLAKVRVIQYLLHLTVDGKFGAKTEAACKAYQAAHGLTLRLEQPTMETALVDILAHLIDEWEKAGGILPAKL